MVVGCESIGIAYLSMKKLPSFLKQYFWEVDFNKLDMQKYPKYIIERLMEYGNLKAIRWMKNNFTNRQINSVLRHMRGFSKKTANFWALVQGVKKEEILCLSKEYLAERKTVWPY